MSFWFERLSALYRQHPRRVLAGVGLALSLLGGAGFALASFDDAPPERRVHQVIETLHTALPGLGLGAPTTPLFRSDMSRASDTADSLLARLGVNDADAADFLRRHDVARQQLLGKAARLVQVEADEQQRLHSLTVRWPVDGNGQDFNRWVVARTAQGFTARLERAPLNVSTRLGSGTIASSLFAATDAADIPDNVATQMADIFSGDIDFQRALRKGDRFAVVYEVLEADGEVLRTGRVLSAEFVNNGKALQAFWFKPSNAKDGGYYNADGISLKRAYLASPLPFSRITSGFKMRFHPILQTWKAHLGVDYAAPTGTPVRSVGQGVVESAGVVNGYGNVVIVKHNASHSTVYAHLSRIAVRRGQRIAQGQVLGAVGMTGWATGPHLHFEFRVNGQHRDPLTMARQSDATPLSAALMPEFRQQVRAAREEISAIHTATADE